MEALEERGGSAVGRAVGHAICRTGGSAIARRPARAVGRSVGCAVVRRPVCAISRAVGCANACRPVRAAGCIVDRSVPRHAEHTAALRSVCAAARLAVCVVPCYCSSVFAHVFLEARSVEVVYAYDAILHVGGRMERCILGEIATLGVPSNYDALGKVGRRRRKVARSLILRGYGHGVRHVEVFLPSDDRLVGAAKPHESEHIAVEERHRCELHLASRVELAQVEADLHRAEARARRQGEQVALDLLGVEAREHGGEVLGAQQVAQGHGGGNGLRVIRRADVQ